MRAGIQRRFERKVDPMLFKGDLDFFSSCPATPKYQRPRTHELSTGIPQNMDDSEENEFTDVVCVIAEDLHLTHCAQACCTGTEEDQAEQHDYGTIGKVLGDPHTERGGDAPEEADREADPPEQMPLPGFPESRPHSFNHEVGIDVFEIIDSVSHLLLTLDAVCMGVAYVRVCVEREFERSSPSFHTSLQAYVCDWSRRASWPKLARYDHGMHDWVQSSSRTVWWSDLLEWEFQNESAERNDEVTCPRRWWRKPSRIRTFQVELKDMILGECLPSYRAKNMRIFRSMGSRRTRQTHCIRKGCTCDRISTSWRHSLVLQRITGW